MKAGMLLHVSPPAARIFYGPTDLSALAACSATSSLDEGLHVLEPVLLLGLCPPPCQRRLVGRHWHDPREERRPVWWRAQWDVCRLQRGGHLVGRPCGLQASPLCSASAAPATASCCLPAPSMSVNAGPLRSPTNPGTLAKASSPAASGRGR